MQKILLIFRRKFARGAFACFEQNGYTTESAQESECLRLSSLLFGAASEESIRLLPASLEWTSASLAKLVNFERLPLHISALLEQQWQQQQVDLAVAVQETLLRQRQENNIFNYHQQHQVHERLLQTHSCGIVLARSSNKQWNSESEQSGLYRQLWRPLIKWKSPKSGTSIQRRKPKGRLQKSQQPCSRGQRRPISSLSRCKWEIPSQTLSYARRCRK
jgi:hypothetical protein